MELRNVMDQRLPSIEFGDTRVLLLAALVWVVIWVVVYTLVSPWRRLQFYRKQGLNGPPFRPFIGNLLELQKIRAMPRNPTPIDETGYMEAAFPHIVQWTTTYAPAQQQLVHQTLTTTQIVLWDASLVREFFTKTSCYKRSHISNVLTSQITGKGIVVLQTDDFWANQRKILNLGFRLQFLKGFHEHMKLAANELIHDWLQEVHKGNCSAELLVSSRIRKASLDTITRAAFGANVVGGVPMEFASKVFEALDERTNVAVASRYSLRLLVPGMSLLLPESQAEKKAARLDTFIDTYLREIVEARIKAVESAYCPEKAANDDSNIGGHDLLGLMVDAMLRGSKTMTKPQIMHECRTLFVGGQATTSQLTSWTLLLLAHHPQWQQKAREEVRQVTGSTGIIEADSVGKLRIVGMILNEVLRLYPPATAVNREATVRHKLGDLEILPGTAVLVPIPMLHQCDKYWHDPLAFKPERFERGIAAACKNNADAFVPFGGGPRICIGLNFALMATKTLLASLLQRLSFRVSPNYQHLPGRSPLARDQGVLLIVEKLES